MAYRVVQWATGAMGKTVLRALRADGEEFPIEQKMEKILFLLAERPFVSWEDVFADERKRRGIIACFLAMLPYSDQHKI